jgi:hypothetical protein
MLVILLNPHEKQKFYEVTDGFSFAMVKKNAFPEKFPLKNDSKFTKIAKRISLCGLHLMT